MLQKLYTWYGMRTVLAVLAVLIIVSTFGIVKMFGGSSATESPVLIDTTPLVETTTVANSATESSISFIGTVEALDRAVIESEASGRVTRVNVALGDQVAAGSIIAQLENASQAAAVLQAEGVYEAALAAAAQSDIGVDESATNLNNAKTTAVSTIKSAFNTINNILVSDIDSYFNQPQSPAPKLVIAGKGSTRTLEIQRVAVGDMMADWKSDVDGVTVDSDLANALGTSLQNVDEILDMVDTFLIIFKEDENSSRTNDFTAIRTTILNTQLALENAITGLTSALDSVRRAALAASGGSSSASDAQIKQALGSLRSAQANFAKTIIRTPIAGTVNKIDVQAGDFISSFEQVAIIANNDALEISIFVGENDLANISVEDEVLIEDSEIGVVTNIAPAVDPVTLKSEVKVATESTNLTTGNTVTVSLKNSELLGKADAPLLVPLTAVKFTADAGSMFTVSSDGILESRAVLIGPISGSFVTITEGIDKDTEFVVDVRGLSAGQSVEVMSKK